MHFNFIGIDWMMMIKKNIFNVFALLLFSSVQAADMSYTVSNYKGYLGKYPVHLSLQYYHFGNNVNVKGSYYYDAYKTPLPLYGVHAGDSLSLCEVTNKNDFEKFIIQGEKFDVAKCPFVLVKKSSGLVGFWKNSKYKWTVNLESTIELLDGMLSNNNENLEVPYWGGTKNHMFIGVYEKNSNGIAINKINVIEKNSGKIIQTINPNLNDCQFGFFMTTIFQNIETYNDGILLNCYSTGADVSVIYGFNKSRLIYSIK